MDNRTKLLTARVLHSKLLELEPPRAVSQSIQAWLADIEKDVRSGVLHDEVAVNDSANVQLINVPRGLKQ